MKKIKSCICLILVCAFFMASATLASARASEQIDIYDMNVTTMDDGGIAIKFSVIGTFIMNRLGAESIYTRTMLVTGDWQTALIKMILICLTSMLLNMAIQFIFMESLVKNIKL